jgi:hypothetical protein
MNNRTVPTTPRPPWLALGLCAALSLLLYWLLLQVAPGFSAAEPSYAGELFPGVKLLTRDQLEWVFPLASFQLLALLAGLFALYGLALWLVRSQRSPRLAALCLAVGAAFLLLQLLSAVTFSTDLYAYTMYGRLFAVYHDDPYLPIGDKYLDDPYLPLAYWLPEASWYGPVWTFVSAGLALVGGEQIGLTVLLFRLVAVGSALLIGLLVYLSLTRLAPARAVAGLVFALWNPLLVLESGLSAHNDAFMAALILLGCWLYLRGRLVLPVLFFGLAVLVKPVFAPALPLFVILVLRRQPGWPSRLRLLARWGALSLGLVALLFGLAGAWQDLPVVAAAGAATSYENNVHELLFQRLRVALGEAPAAAETPVHFNRWWALAAEPTALHAGPDPADAVIDQSGPDQPLLVLAPAGEDVVLVYHPASSVQGYVARSTLEKADRPDWADADAGTLQLEPNPVNGPLAAQANRLLRGLNWLLFGAIWLLAAWRTRDEASWLSGSALIMLAAVWLVATETWSWYAIWPLALAALAPRSRPALLAAILSATVLTLHVSRGFEDTAWSWVYTYRSLPAFVLPLLLFVGVTAVQRLAGRRIRSLAPSPARSDATGTAA